MKIEKAIDFIKEKIEENKNNAMKVLSLTIIAIKQGGLETIANSLQGLFVGITLLCWAFVGIKLLTGYGLLSLPFASRMMKERGHREAEESIGTSLLVAIGVTLITLILSIVKAGFPNIQEPSWNK